MKKIAYITFFPLFMMLFLSNISSKRNIKHFDKNIFENDSGYVSLKNGKQFLIELNRNDTIDISFEKLNENDTIGKFYKKVKSQNYILYLNDILNTKLSPSQFILEIDSNSNIIKSERYINGFYLCCWKNKFDGFGKLDDYFYLKTCGTGSAFCSTQLYIFKEIVPQEELNPIIKSLYNGLCEFDKKKTLACMLESKIETKSNSLIFHYEYKRGILKKIEKYKKLEKFDVEYILKNNNWIAKDSTKLNEIEY